MRAQFNIENNIYKTRGRNAHTATSRAALEAALEADKAHDRK